MFIEPKLETASITIILRPGRSATLVAVCETSSNLSARQCYVIRGGVALVGWFVATCYRTRVKTFSVDARVHYRSDPRFGESPSVPAEAWRYPRYTVTDLQLYEAVAPPVNVAVADNAITYSVRGFGNTLMAGTCVLQYTVSYSCF